MTNFITVHITKRSGVEVYHINPKYIVYITEWENRAGIHTQETIFSCDESVSEVIAMIDKCNSAIGG